MGVERVEREAAARRPEPGAARAAAVSSVERAAGALGDGTRRGILMAFLDDGRPRTVDEVAAMVGVHRTVAFGHLERLVNLGYLTRGQRRGRPGKPAALYAPVAGPLSVQYPARQFAALAGLLATALEDVGERGREAARVAGRGFGEASAAGRAAHSAAEALEALEPMGAAYDLDGDVVTAANCVFQEACMRSPAVVCALHAGILEGAMRGAGLRLHAEPAGPAPPSGCAFRLVRR